MNKYIEIEWTTVHFAQINLEAIKHDYDKFVITMSPDDALMLAIREEVAGLNDSEYYSWDDDANEQVKQAFMREYDI